MNAQQLLQRKYQEQLQDVYQDEEDYAERIRVNSLMGGEMSGGYGNAQASKLRSEAAETKTALKEDYRLKSEYLKEQEDEIKEQQRKEKLGGWLKAGGQLLGAGVGLALAPATGGMSLMTGLGIGAGAGGMVGEVGNTLFGTGAPPQIDFGFLADYQDYKHRKKIYELENPSLTYNE